jgi:hypothetical protein
MTSSLVEKCTIGAALLAGFPLGLSLDTDILGFKRFVWVGASLVGLFNLLCLDPASDYAGYADKMCLALLSVALVPHFIQLVKDQQYMALGMVPPFLMVIHASMATPIGSGGSEEYWRHRTFLHIFVFLMPYLNHLPSAPAPESSVEDDDVNRVNFVENNSAARSVPNKSSGSSKPAKTRTNKKKR